MPSEDFGKYTLTMRTNEHNHKNQRAHLHVSINDVEIGTMFLDRTYREGKILSRDLKKLSKIITENAAKYQALWDEYQGSKYCCE